MKLELKITENKYFNVKEILKEHFEISDRLLIKLKKNKKIFLNGSPVYVTEKVSIGDYLYIDLDFEEKTENIVPQKMDLDIVYEDEWLLVINKSPRNTSSSINIAF